MKQLRSVLFIFVVFMIAKDLAYAPFPYALRVIAQGLCLIVGGFWFLRHGSTEVLARYWPIFAYLAVMFLTLPLTDYPGFVLLQAGSLTASIVFMIAYHESQASHAGVITQRDFIRFVLASYALIAITSLILAKLMPGLAYEDLFAGSFIADEIRFKGVFGKAGGMGQAAGLLLGFAAITIRKPLIKLSLVSVALACLALTQSRSFWIGSLVAGIATLWIYFPKWRLRAVLIVCVPVVAVMVYQALGKTIDTDWAARAARVNTLSTLTGRTYLWQQAAKGFQDSPLVGFGFTLGSTGLPELRPKNAWTSELGADPTQFSRVTLHNGYVQSLMDTGILGTLFYLLTMIVAVRNVINLDTARRFPQLLYALLFLCISNAGESVIYSGSMFPSLCFWACAVCAMSLKRADLQRSALTCSALEPEDANNGGLATYSSLARHSTTRHPNLMSG